MRHSQSEKMEIIRVVENSSLGVKRTLIELDINRSTFYDWYRRYREGGYDALASKPPNRRQFWNAIPPDVKQKVVETVEVVKEVPVEKVVKETVEVEKVVEKVVTATPPPKVTIRITTWAGVEESAELQEVIDEVNAQVDHFEIVHEPAPDDYYTKVQTALAGGTSADLIWLSQEWIAGMADQGALLDITDYLEGDTVHPAGDLSDYFDDILKTAMYKGHVRPAQDRPAGGDVLQQSSL